MTLFFRSLWGLAAGCALAATAFDGLLYGAGRPVGWTAGLFLWLALALILRRGGPGVGAPLTRAWLVGLAGLGIAHVIEPCGLGLALSIFGLLTLMHLVRQGPAGSASTWGRHLAQVCAGAAGGVFLFGESLTHAHRWRQRRSSVIRRFPWLGLLLILSFAGVFLALFSLANPILEKGLNRLSTGFINALRDAPRLIIWTMMFGVFWGGLRFARGGPSVTMPAPSAARREGLFTPRLLVFGLGLFNVLFLLQTVTDGLFLWGHRALPDGMTYAAYAHRGAYPLVLTALLAGLFVLATFQDGESSNAMKTPRRLAVLWMLQNVSLTASSLLRLDIYVEAYGLTRLRLYAGIWMGLVGLGLVLLTVRILRVKSNVWLLRANACLAGGVLYAACFLPLDRAIADYNVAHCRETSGHGFAVDVNYLTHLGPEALPALDRLRGGGSDQAIAADSAAELIRRTLARDLEDLRRWTWRRHRLAKDGK